MDELTPTAKWTITQPWRGLFGIVVTLGCAFTITAIFDIQAYNGIFTTFLMSNVPILVILTLGLQVKYPSTEGMPRPWGAFLLTAFVLLMGFLISRALIPFVAGGAPTPFIQVQAILTVIVTFFLVIAWGMWPFHKMSLAGKGFLTLILAYIIAWLLLKLFNFSLLSHPDGIIPSGVGAVPFYAKGGPLAPFAAYAPISGPFTWEAGLTVAFWSLVFLFVFAVLQMWPFHKFPGVMKQPVMGIVLTIVCFILGLIAYAIGVGGLNIAPLMFLLYGISYLFGVLMFMTMFQMWPGRGIKSPVGGGFLNLILAIIVAIIAYYGIKAFCVSHFGADAMKHPTDVFTMGNLMLGITFPAWAAFQAMWDFWPLPSTPPPPDPA
jgi:hypothetical protein